MRRIVELYPLSPSPSTFQNVIGIQEKPPGMTCSQVRIHGCRDEILGTGIIHAGELDYGSFTYDYAMLANSKLISLGGGGGAWGCKFDLQGIQYGSSFGS